MKKKFRKKNLIIIAEAGVNHNGDLKIAKKLINEAAKAGADVIKFQHYKTESLISQNLVSKKNIFKKLKLEKNFKMLKKYELSFEQMKKLSNYSIKKNIIFAATPFDNKSADDLAKLNVPFYKISSGDINNFSLLKHVLKKNKPVIFSTGRSSFKEIKETVLFFKKNKFKKYSILHCVSVYPAEVETLNLKSISYLKKKFKCNIGFSDHTKGSEAAIAALTLGAQYIEKHITLNHNDSGPDHKASMEPLEFKEMVKSLRKIEKAIGKEKKIVLGMEKFGRIKSRRSIFASRDLNKNKVLKEEDLICKRPAIGIEPKFIFKIIGKKMKKKTEEGKPLSWGNIH